MRLAKPHLDIGLFTNDLDEQREFWSEQVGLRLDHELPLADGWVQHRFDAHDSVVKVNHLVDPLPALPPTGYAGLTLAGERPGWSARHPGGQPVRMVAPGSGGVAGIGVTVSTPDPDRMMDFYRRAMEFDAVDARTARCGDSLLSVVEGPGGSDTTGLDGLDGLKGPGFRYLTVQIFDADAACSGIEARGGTVVIEPRDIGTVARYGFVADPDGNWIEISARASLTGTPPGGGAGRAGG
jgi:lactoylglutathione lyase